MYDNDVNNNTDNYDYSQMQGEYQYYQGPEKDYRQPSPAYTPSRHYTAKKKDSGHKFAAVALSVALGCGSLGVGLGMGSGLYKHLFNSTETAVTTYEVKEAAEEAATTYKISEAAEVTIPPQAEEAQTPRMILDKTAAGAGETDVAEVIKGVSNSVVSINVKATAADFFNRVYEYPSAGSGVIFSEDDDNIFIATNNHVIKDASDVQISIDDTNSVKASPMGSDPQSDLAVIKVSKADLAAAGISDYKIAAFGDAEVMEVGETVIAIGNAQGQGKSATLGIISAKNKQISADNNQYLDVIQTDAAINGGNSGGALVNLEGRVIGINTAKLSAVGVEGMGYAIPSNTVKEIVDTIMESGSVERPYLGIIPIDFTDDMKRAYSIPVDGVGVYDITAGGGAEAAGIVPGDIIVSVNGIQVANTESLQNEIAKAKIGDKLEIGVYRGSETQNFTVEIMDANASF